MDLRQKDTSERTKLTLSNSQSSIKLDLYSTEHHEKSHDGPTVVLDRKKRSESTGSDNDPNLEQKLNKKSDFFKLPRRKLMILGYSTFGRLFMNAAISIFNPIFPIEAKEKAIEGVWVKLIFGILFLVVFITCPIFGRYQSRIGPNFVLISSLYVNGVVNLFFAFLHYGPSGTSYLVLVILSRCFIAVTKAGYSTVTQAVVFYEFQGNMGIAQSILQSGTIFGFVIGPALSGFLYQAGGFCLPFYLIGSIIIVTAIVTHLTLPDINNSITISTNENRVSAFALLKNPLIVLTLVCLVTGSMGMISLSGTLTVMLLPFGISMVSIGFVFVMIDAFDTVGTFFWAYVTERLKKEGVAVLFGLLIYFVGYIMLGPAPFLSFIPHNVTMICVSVGLIGAAFGSSLTPVLKCLLTASTEMGYKEDDFSVVSVISGLFNSLLMLGGFCGQFLMGLVGNAYGNDVMYTVIAFMNAGAFLTTASFLLYRKRQSRFKSPPSTPINDKMDSIRLLVESGHW